MNKYFKMMHEIAGDVSNLNSKEITVMLAEKAGYSRQMYTFNNGQQRERTFYSKGFDEVLTAKWFCYYEKMFRLRLNKFYSWGEKVIDIINDTFYTVMNSIDLEKIVNSKVMDKYTNFALSSKIKAFLITNCQISQDNKKYNKKMANGKFVLDRNTIQMSNLIYDMDFEDDTVDETYSNMEMFFERYFAKNSIGMKLLDAMLISGDKIEFNRIDAYLDLSKDECTENNRKRISSAYNTISKSLSKEYGIKQSKTMFPCNIKYSFEV